MAPYVSVHPLLLLTMCDSDMPTTKQLKKGRWDVSHRIAPFVSLKMKIKSSQEKTPTKTTFGIREVDRRKVEMNKTSWTSSFMIHSVRPPTCYLAMWVVGDWWVWEHSHVPDEALVEMSLFHFPSVSSWQRNIEEQCRFFSRDTYALASVAITFYRCKNLDADYRRRSFVHSWPPEENDKLQREQMDVVCWQLVFRRPTTEDNKRILEIESRQIQDDLFMCSLWLANNKQQHIVSIWILSFVLPR